MAKLDFDQAPSCNESGILVMLWRKILKESGLSNSLNTLIEKYLNKHDKTEGRIKSVKKQTKSTIVNNITASEMTFKTFMNLLLNLLNAKRVKLTVEITYPSDRTTTHSISVLSSSYSEEKSDTDGGTDERNGSV